MDTKLAPVSCILCENRLGRYCVPASSQHRPASKRVIEGGVWEPDTIEFMKASCGSRDIVHAGMFFGDFLPAISSFLRGGGGEAWCFEPNPESFRCAQWTAAINDVQNIRMFNLGLGAHSKSARMRTSLDGVAMGGGSRVLKDGVKIVSDAAGVEAIEVVAIDDIIPASADIGIIQLDVEGYEEFALAGALNTIARCRPIVILETVPQRYVEQSLLPTGYALTGKVSGNSIFRPL